MNWDEKDEGFCMRRVRVSKLGFWKKFSRVWLLVEVNGMKFVLRVFIG